MEKLTKRDRRILALQDARAVYKRLLAAGYRDWEPGERIAASDGTEYEVQPNHEWRRVTPRGYWIRKYGVGRVV